jgi:hypothetical protein
MSMTTEEWMDYWRERLAKLFIVCGAESLRRRLPDDSHLQRIEAQYQLRLPTSYCGFVRVFGPGMLARAFAIYAPGYKGRNVIDFHGNNKAWQVVGQEYATHWDEQCRFICLGDYLGTYQPFVWKILDAPQEAADFEKAIYYFPRRTDEPLILVASSFQDFVERCCLGGGFHSQLGSPRPETWIDEETGESRSYQCFEPIGQDVNSRI